MFYSIIVFITSLLIVNSSIAGIEKKFDAICLPDKNKCRVYLNPNEFRFDEKGIIKSIPIKQISSWSLGGKGTKSDVGKILYAPLFPPAAIGLFTSSHQYIFTINYLDSEGIENYDFSDESVLNLVESTPGGTTSALSARKLP